jgi:hypothetical protein
MGVQALAEGMKYIHSLCTGQALTAGHMLISPDISLTTKNEGVSGDTV